MTWREALNNLKSLRCQCGSSKDRGRVFCFRCYWSLPVDMRNALWRRMGQGFEEACEGASRWLQGRPEDAQ
jgi:hypothetical protein